MSSTDESFEAMTVPHEWYVVSQHLFESSMCLYSNRRTSGTWITKKDASGTALAQEHSFDRSFFLLGGFALENIIKAFLVYEDPQLLANGKLNFAGRSHQLNSLADQSRMLPWPKKRRTTLKVFEDGLTSWARYPSGRQFSGAISVLTPTPELCSAYQSTYARFASEIERLLKLNWLGPHGFEGSYEFS